jgi:hypothetical protein
MNAYLVKTDAPPKMSSLQCREDEELEITLDGFQFSSNKGGVKME